MNADKVKRNRLPINLTLKPAIIAKAEKLKKTLHRPSVSNVVEFLIEQAHETALSAGELSPR